MPQYRAEVTCRTKHDDSLYDQLLDALGVDPAMTPMLEIVNPECVRVVLYLSAIHPLGAQTTAFELVTEAWPRPPLNIERVAVEAADSDLVSPATSVQGHRSVSILGMLSNAERMVYVGVETLNAYGKNATAKHLREFLAEKLETVADLMVDNRIEQVLSDLTDKGFLDPIPLVPSNPGDEPIRTDRARGTD